MKNPLKIALCIEQTSNHTRGIAKGVSLYAQTHGPWIFSIIEKISGGGLVAPPQNRSKGFDSDGIIAYTQETAVLDELLQFGVPVVNTTQTTAMSPEVPFVASDDRALGRLVANHFMDKGFKEFAFCGSVSYSPCSFLRGAGFREELEKEGFEVSFFSGTDHPSRKIDWNRDRKKVARWIRSLGQPLALFADNDSAGRVLADICRELDIHVPEEVAIVGANNDELICEFSNPHLSSVALAKEQVGFEAAELVEQLIQKKKIPALPILVPPLGITTRRSSEIFAVEDPHIAKALNFIYTYAGEAIGVEDILKELPLCRRTLEIRFRNAIGRSPYEEIRRAHVKRAKKLLAETNLPLDRIAEASGFSETKHFYLNFRKETGLSPTQFRKRFKGTTTHPVEGQGFRTG